MKITDGEAERSYRVVAREAQAAVRALTDELWGRAAKDEISWDEARARITAARAAFEKELAG